MVEVEFGWMSVYEVFMWTVWLVTHRPALDFSLAHLVNLVRTKVNPLCYCPKLSSSDNGADGTHLYSYISPSTKSLLLHRFHGVRSGFELLSNVSLSQRRFLN
jgi:hypothetical protein